MACYRVNFTFYSKSTLKRSFGMQRYQVVRMAEKKGYANAHNVTIRAHRLPCFLVTDSLVCFCCIQLMTRIRDGSPGFWVRFPRGADTVLFFTMSRLAPRRTQGAFTTNEVAAAWGWLFSFILRQPWESTELYLLLHIALMCNAHLRACSFEHFNT
jgi:hypothetical protein